MTGGADFGWDPHLPGTPGSDWAAASGDLFGFDAGTPFMPRVWNALASGTDNFPVDRTFVEHAKRLVPRIVDAAHYRHVFRARAVRALVGEYGIGQLLVVGIDLPVRDEVHDIAERVDSSVRTVYADPDSFVMMHARVSLDSPWADACAFVDAGLDNPAALIVDAEDVLDLAEPVGVLLINSLDHLDDAAAAHFVSVLCGALPPGSCIAICHLTGETCQGLATLGDREPRPIPGLPHARTPAGVRALFTGLELLAPGVVPVPLWRPEPSPWQPEPVDLWGGAGRVLGPLPDRGLR